MHCNLPTGPKTNRSGRDHALVNLSAAQAKKEGLLTSATFGQPSNGLSNNVDLQLSLESKLRARLDVNGSTEYSLTWKYWDIAPQRQICALRASMPRTSGRGCFGWPTPMADNDRRTPEQHLAMKNRMGRNRTSITSLNVLVKTGWATVLERDFKSESASQDFQEVRAKNTERGKPLSHQVLATGWPTLVSTDAIKRGNVSPRKNAMGLSETLGQTISGLNAEMEKPVALNPEFCRWLMGFPEGWSKSKATETP